MAITLDTSTKVNNSTSDPVAFNHTVATDANLLIVCVNLKDATKTVSGVTYGGQALTKAVGRAANSLTSEIWYKANPLTGTNQVSVDLSATDNCTVVASSWKDVNALGLVDTINNNTDTTANPSTSVTITAADCLLIDALTHESGTLGTEPSGTSILNKTDEGVWTTYDVYKLSVTGSQTFTYTISADSWTHVMAAFKPVTAQSSQAKASILNSVTKALTSKANIRNTAGSKTTMAKAEIDMFVELFGSTTYKDTGATTADWNVTEGRLKLGST
jgi:hypothetical protein